MAYVVSFMDLEVYKLSRQLQKRIFQLSTRFPKEEMYSLTDQVRRSSRSVGTQLAECWAKRRYERYFISKLTDADGEQSETQHWIESAKDCDYLTSEIAYELLSQYSFVGKMINIMILKAPTFCYKVSSGDVDDSETL